MAGTPDICQLPPLTPRAHLLYFYLYRMKIFLTS